MRTYCVTGTKTDARAIKIKIGQLMPTRMVERYVSNLDKKCHQLCVNVEQAVREDILGGGNIPCVF